MKSQERTAGPIVIQCLMIISPQWLRQEQPYQFLVHVTVDICAFPLISMQS